MTNSNQVQGFAAGEEGLRGALENADVVVVPAGVPRKPGMTRDGKRTHPLLQYRY